MYKVAYDIKIKILTAITLLAVFFLNAHIIGSFWYLKEVNYSDQLAKNNISALKNKFKNVSKLTEGEQKLGFVSDVSAQEVFTNPKTTKIFYNIQYAIAPLILENNLKNRFAVAVAVQGKKIILTKKYKIVKNLGDGFILIERAE